MLSKDRPSDRDLQRAIGTEVYEAGFFDPNGGYIHPMKLAHVFKAAAEKACAEIYENTTVASIEEGREHLLHTTGGRNIRAKSLVSATNAFTARLGFFRNSFVPVHDYVAVTQPFSDSWPRSDGVNQSPSMTAAPKSSISA